MDYLDRYQAEQEERQERLARREAIASTAAVGSAALADRDKPHTDVRAEDYPVTVIGCVRGIDGWYRAGFDEKTKTIKPLERMP